jgi:hypothetical protein
LVLVPLPGTAEGIPRHILTAAAFAVPTLTEAQRFEAHALLGELHEQVKAFPII